MPAPADRRAVAKGFNLVMQLEDPRRLGELMEQIAKIQPRTRAALGELDYVHFARFLPLWDIGRLLIVTEFDGSSMKDYVLDFAAVLDDEFSMILSYMKDGPRLPVSRYPDDFWAYVERNTQPGRPFPEHPEPFCAYRDKTVIDIIGLKEKIKTITPAPRKKEPPALQLGDVQANVLRGYGGRHGVHIGVRFGSADHGRELLRRLLDGEPRITSAEDLGRGASYCLNIGLTHAGLRALRAPAPVLERFSRAFRDGPAAHIDALAADGHSPGDPKQWRIGKPGQAVHAMLSLYTKERSARDDAWSALAGVLELCHAGAEFAQPVDALDAEGMRVPFGYRDGLSQPHVEGVAYGRGSNDGRPSVPAGDFLLGAGQVNGRGGNFAGGLPAGLADNGTFAAVQVLEQDEQAFEDLLDAAAKQLGRDDEVGREFVAAKLMGRWRDGSPLVEHEAQAAGWQTPPNAVAGNGFDYATANGAGYDDREGLRCPLGAHIRRMNPRGSLVMGVPALRRLIRRGLPYQSDGGSERGLFGIFYCGDIESQFEFLLGTWGYGDLATTDMIRNTVDPFAPRSKNTPFRFSPGGGAKPIEIEVPPLVMLQGSLYLFVPGLKGLRWIADAGWIAQPEAAQPAPPVQPAPAEAKAKPAAAAPAKPRAFDIDAFSPLDPAFRVDPYPFYARFRTDKPVHKIATHGSYWVFSRELVERVCKHPDDFPKPDRGQQKKLPAPFAVAANYKDGLFFMNDPRHSEVRPRMEAALDRAIDGIAAYTEEQAHRLLDVPLRNGRFDIVGEYAAPLPTRVFMKVMGIPPDDAKALDNWVRTALDGHDKGATRDKQLGSLSASMALRSYFHALGVRPPKERPVSSATPLMRGITALTRVGHVEPDEAMQTALHFALGGYLSTEFLITTGVHNLLRHETYQTLRDNPALLPKAIREMLRYDAPFQMADRTAAHDGELGGVEIKKGSKIVVAYGSANRDRVFGDDAEAFKIERDTAERHYGFGHGMHRCIGEVLAPTVATIAFRVLLERCPCMTILETGEWLPDPYFRSLRRLLVSLN